MIRHIALAVGLGLTAPVAVMAQTAEAPEAPAQAPQAMDSAATYLAARNQLGILKYCNTEGFSGEEAVESQTKLIGMLPDADEEAGAAAEQKGAEGTVSIGEAEMTLADAAASQNSNVEQTCKQIEAAVNQVAPTMPAG
jgi:hypothetical protein